MQENLMHSQKREAKKKKPLFDQMWDTVEATIVTMLSLEKANPQGIGVKPFLKSRKPVVRICKWFCLHHGLAQYHV